MKRLILALAACVSAILASVTVSLAQADYTIRSGDTLRVEVLEDPNLNRNALVLPDGRFSFPLAGTVNAGGMTVGQVQSVLADRLASNFANRPTVFVSVAELSQARPSNGMITARTYDVYIMGEAAKPGKYEVEPGTTLLQFIASTGGLSRFAATKRLKLTRIVNGREKVYTFNFKAIEAGLAAGGSTLVADGDVIVIPQRRLFE